MPASGAGPKRIAFLNIGMHGRVNPTLPIAAELVRRGHTVSYHTSPAFSDEIAATGASPLVYAESDHPLPDPPVPITLLEGLAGTALRVLPTVLAELRDIRPDLIVHDSACVWGAVAARELGVPAVSSFTTFAFNRRVPSPTRASWRLLAEAATRPASLAGYLRSRGELSRRFDARGLPLFDLGNVRQALNLVYTSRAFQPHVESFDASYRFVGPSLGARPIDPSFAAERLTGPVMYASLGTVFNADPRLLRSFATALAPLGGTVVLATGQTDPAALGPLPANVLARRFVPQLEVLAHAALFVTHGGMNSVNEAMDAGVPMLVIPQGAEQPMVARRVVELGAGLALHTQDATEIAVRAAARRLLDEPRFREAAAVLQVAQRDAGGYLRGASELERYLAEVESANPAGHLDPSPRS
ncbi:MAG TPA: macrolide family glycosyltransferase [Agromyces sp.]